MLRCYPFLERELSSHGRLIGPWLHARGTHYRLTLDLVALCTPLNDISIPTYSDSLIRKPPVPLYPVIGL